MLGTIISRRYISNGSLLKVSLNQYYHDPIKLVVIPLTQTKSFLYFKHNTDLLNKSSRVISIERWFVGKSIALWQKMQKSPNKLNIKIVSLVETYLSKIPWQERSLLTIPGESYIKKAIKTDSHYNDYITNREYKQVEPKPNLKPLPIYYPLTLLDKEQLISQLQMLSKEGIQYHRKQILKCLFILPLTFPLILIPIVPNVPGFYITYRMYCNFKAYLGAKHLQQIMKDNLLELRDLEEYSSLFRDHHGDSGLNQRLNLSKLDQIVPILKIENIKQNLIDAIKQEKSENPEKSEE